MRDSTVELGNTAKLDTHALGDPRRASGRVTEPVRCPEEQLGSEHRDQRIAREHAQHHEHDDQRDREQHDRRDAEQDHVETT